MSAIPGVDQLLCGPKPSLSRRIGMNLLLGISFVGAGISFVATAPIFVLEFLPAYQRWKERRQNDLRESIRKRFA